MGTTGRHKVCFEIAGRPAISRALDTYTACGIGPHIVVVGALAEQVMHTISQSGHEAIYAFQAEQRGTGHAAKQGARILQQIGYTGPVLVVAGDVIIQPVALRKLLTVFAQSDCDLALMVGPREHAPTAGRVVTDEDGHPLTIVETRDISRRRALAQVREMAQARVGAGAADLRQEVLQVLQRFIPDADKAKLAFGTFWDRLHQAAPLDAPAILGWVPPTEIAFHLADASGRPLTLAVDTVDQMPWINLSVYLCRAPALYYALERLTDENAQREEYLTDIVSILSQAQGAETFHLQIVPVDDPEHVMSFNTLRELQAIEAYYQRLIQDSG